MERRKGRSRRSQRLTSFEAGYHPLRCQNRSDLVNDPLRGMGLSDNSKIALSTFTNGPGKCGQQTIERGISKDRPDGVSQA